MSKTAVCTIVSKNYLHYARTLMASLETAEPDWERWVLVVDRIDGEFDPAAERFRVLRVEELPIGDHRMLFHYNILELNTAVKPWLLSWLFEKNGFDRVVYLDPDIRVYGPMSDVTRRLDGGALAVLTPHLTGRLRDDRHPSELDILRAGTYNLGFIALGRHRDLGGMLEYWSEKSLVEFASDPAKGLFTDQKWIDLVPGLFDGASVLRHPGYNVAYWNLAHRKVSRGASGWRVDGEPLVFFHFSGLDPLSPERFSKHQDRFRLDDLGDAKGLVLDYCREVLAAGAGTCRGWPYAFARFDSGEEIPQAIRTLYRSSPEFARLLGDDPFAARLSLLDRPARPGPDIVPTWAMQALWETRDDLRRAFPEPAGGNREEFAAWWVDGGAAGAGFPPARVEPVEKWLAGRRRAATPVATEPLRSPAPVALPPPTAPSGPLDRLLRRRPAPPRLPDDASVAGFHDQSAADRILGVAWMGWEAAVRLENGAGRELEIRGFHRPGFFLKARRGRRLTVDLEVEGRRLGRMALRDAGPFEVRFRLPAALPSSATLRLRASSVFVPVELGINDDARPLSVQIREMALDGVTFLTFLVPPADPPVLAPPPTRLATDLEGFYDQDAVDRQQGFAWMGRVARLRLSEVVPGARIVVRGEYHSDPIARTHGDHGLRLAMFLDGERLSESVFKVGGRIEATAWIPEPPPPRREGAAHLLVLEADRVFNLSKLGISADLRELSCRISTIEVAGQEVVDFSRPAGSAWRSPTFARAAERLGINVIGYARAESGVGQSARGSAAACEAAGIPHRLYDFRDGLGEGAPGTSELLEKGPPHRVNLLHVNADQVPVVLPLLGPAVTGGRFNVGVWHWELPELPDEWLGAFDGLDEIWAPSRFVLETVSKKSPIPVVHMPHGVAFGVTKGASRRDFGLPEGKFLFLMMYDSSSFAARKNPEGVLDAFRLAFPAGRGDVGLVVKTMNAEGSPELEALREKVAALPGAILLNEKLTRQRAYDLEAVVDGYVALHRAEGWGMNFIESMYLGKPVVGTNWSGNTEFMHPGNSGCVGYRLVELDRDHGPYRKGQRWAEPDLDEASTLMRRLVDDPSWRQKIAAAGRETILRDYSPAAAGARYRKRLEIVARMERA